MIYHKISRYTYIGKLLCAYFFFIHVKYYPNNDLSLPPLTLTLDSQKLRKTYKK